MVSIMYYLYLTFKLRSYCLNKGNNFFTILFASFCSFIAYISEVLPLKLVVR